MLGHHSQYLLVALLIPSIFPCLSRQKTSYKFFCCSGLGSFLLLSVAVQSLSTACRGKLIVIAATSVCCQLSAPLLLCKPISPFVSEYTRKIMVCIDTVINLDLQRWEWGGAVHKVFFRVETTWR